MININPLPELHLSYELDNALLDYISSNKYKSIFILTGPHVSKSDSFKKLIVNIKDKSRIITVFNSCKSDPTFNQVDEMVEIAKLDKVDCIIGIGGGSPLDASKIVALLLDKKTKCRDLFPDHGKLKREIPLILIPTSSGTGSEVTPISILTDEVNKLKMGVLNNTLIPDKAFLYGELTTSMPRSVTATTGIDALCHATEAYISKSATTFSDIWALESLKLIKDNLLEAFNEPNNLKVRYNMLIASMYAGIAFSNSSVTAVHAFAYPLGGEYHIAHGLANSIMFPPIFNYNLSQCKERYETLTEILCGEKNPKMLVPFVQSLIEKLELPRSLKELGIKESSIQELSEKVMTIERLLSKNPKKILKDDALKIYKEAYIGY